MNRTAYKVVHPVRGDFFSLSYFLMYGYPSDFVLCYKLGERTLPKMGRIYVFATAPEAQKFADDYSGTKILKGTAENVGYPKFISGFCQDFGRFWKSHRKTYVPPPNVAVTQYLVESMPDWVFCRKPPQGTLTCSTFTPTELIEN